MSARSSDARPIDASFHHGDHCQLLVEVPVAEAEYRPVDAAEIAQLRDSPQVPVIAIDAAKCGPMLPAFTSTRLLDQTKRFRHGADTGTKRSLGLVLARVAGRQRVLFSDDDIYSGEPSRARAEIGLLDQFNVISTHLRAYPDNSAVCHFNRIMKELLKYATHPGFARTERRSWQFINLKHCGTFMEPWRAYLRRFYSFIESFPISIGIDKALTRPGPGESHLGRAVFPIDYSRSLGHGVMAINMLIRN